MAPPRKTSPQTDRKILAEIGYHLALREELERYSYRAIGQRHGLSYNAVWKRLACKDIYLPDISYAESLERRIAELEESNSRQARYIKQLQQGR